MDPKGKGIVINDKEKESFVNEPKDDKPTDSGSGQRRKEGKKKKTRRIKEIVYYDSDESTSSQKDEDHNDYERRKPVNSNFSFDYSRIPQSSHSHLLSIPLGKPPHFDGEDYGFWSHKMRSHLFSLHPSIWEIVESGMHFDSSDSPMFINEQIHKNAQATTVLLASLCRNEYHKVSGLDNAKQIWDTLKISHEGNDVTLLTKMELVEGELGRFAMIRGEEPTQTYNRLKTLINKIRSYGSTRWTDHDVVRLMLRSFTVLDPHLVNNIRENPRYTKMSPEEVLGKFVSGRMMIKEARYVDDALNGPINEPQPLALKATRSKEALPSKVAQIEAAGLNDEEMALIIKRFKTALNGRKGQPSKTKTKGKRSCFKCGKLGHFIANCPDNESDQEKGNKREKKKQYKKAKGEAHLGKEWDSDCSSSDSDNEGLAATAFNKSALFPNERLTCLMAREKKVSTQDSTYASSSDSESSDDDIDYSCLFKGLDRSKIDKINELIDALNEKDRLLEKQEDLLYDEHDKFVEAQKSYALEVKRNEMLSYELSTCHETISTLQGVNNDLNAKLEVANKSNSCVEHVKICTRCKDFDVDACSEHLVLISKLNKEVASLNAQLKTSKNEVDKIKFARDAYTVGRHPSIKDGLGFKREAKNLTSHKAPIFVKEKGKAPMASNAKKNHAFMYYDRRNARNAYNDFDSHVYDSHAMFASSSSYKHDRDMPRRNIAHVPRKNVIHAPRKVVNEPSIIYCALNTSFAICRKDRKIVARKLGAKCKGDRTCIWVPKDICANLAGPNMSWVPKTQA